MQSLRSWFIRISSALAIAGCAAGAGSALTTTGGAIGDPSTGSGTSGAGGKIAIGGSGSGGSGFEPCAKTVTKAEPVPVSMFIAIDKSGSMRDDDKWKNASAAFAAFFQDPAAASDLVALRLWPDGGCDDVACDASKCAVPQIALGPLSDPAQQKKLIDRLNATQPNGGTPMSAALDGACQWAEKHQADVGTSEKVVVLFVTDGEPNGCVQDIASIAAFAAAGQKAGILTFAVGLQGSNEAQLDAIAQAGGTAKAFFVGNGNAVADLIAALQQIQSASLPCTFKLPLESGGKAIDPKQVELDYLATSASSPVAIPKVAGPSDCGGPGWYYDDEQKPSAILLCPASCTAAQASKEGKVELVLGCSDAVK